MLEIFCYLSITGIFIQINYSIIFSPRESLLKLSAWCLPTPTALKTYAKGTLNLDQRTRLVTSTLFHDPVILTQCKVKLTFEVVWFIRISPHVQYQIAKLIYQLQYLQTYWYQNWCNPKIDEHKILDKKPLSLQIFERPKVLHVRFHSTIHEQSWNLIGHKRGYKFLSDLIMKMLCFEQGSISLWHFRICLNFLRVLIVT